MQRLPGNGSRNRVIYVPSFSPTYMNARLFWHAVAVIGMPSIACAQQLPMVHPVGAIVAKTQEPIGQLGGIHVLSDGRVLVNDAGGRGGSGRVLLFDSTLATFSVVLDTAGGAARKYPNTSGAVIPFAGDSTIFYDPIAVALVVLDRNGRIARIMAPPFPPDAGYLRGPSTRFDPAERAVYQANVSPSFRPDAMGFFPMFAADSLPGLNPIVRATPGRPAPETLAFVRAQGVPTHEPFTTKEGATIQREVINPFVVIDDWAMLPDGTVAVVRGQDYHIDWISPDGQRSASPKLPFPWHRLSDSEKTVIVDSVRQWAEANPRRYNTRVNGQPVSGTVAMGVIAPERLADYRAPFARGAVLADVQGNVWILPTPETPLSSKPGPVYDVVNRGGQLIDRVQLSPGFGIVGFSRGYVFMSIREGATTVLVKARIR
jgi:hypothetical protein